MLKILDGRRLTRELLVSLADKIKKRRLNLTLAVVAVGQNLVSKKYLEQKKRAAQATGIGFCLFDSPQNISEPKLKNEIEKIVQNPGNSGIVVQLSLPKHLEARKILSLIPPAKDPDCLSAENFGRFCLGNGLLLPPVVGAVKKLFEEYKIKAAGKNAVVVGAGRLVGLPVSIWLMQQGATVTVCHRLTKDLTRFTRSADIVISGAGQPNLIKGAMIRRGAVVVDCGTSVENGRTVGDIETQSVIKKARFLAPVPGGIGPLTVACLLENLLVLSETQHK